MEADAGDVERRVLYFGYCGEANTDVLLARVRGWCGEAGCRRVVVASETGASALRASDALKGSGIGLVVVTHYPAKTTGPRGEIPIGLRRPEYAEALRRLEDAGVPVVQGTRPLAPPTRSLGWGYPTPPAVVDATLELFGAGTKIAVEAALMATDAGALDEGEVVASCAGTYKGLDTALAVRTAYSMNFFREFEVQEVIAKPLRRVRALPEHGHENWRGDLDRYYRGLG